MSLDPISIASGLVLFLFGGFVAIGAMRLSKALGLSKLGRYEGVSERAVWSSAAPMNRWSTF